MAISLKRRVEKTVAPTDYSKSSGVCIRESASRPRICVALPRHCAARRNGANPESMATIPGAGFVCAASRFKQPRARDL
jgi:hypothetical protein